MLKFENKFKKGLFMIKRVVYLCQLKTQTLNIMTQLEIILSIAVAVILFYALINKTNYVGSSEDLEEKKRSYYAKAFDYTLICADMKRLDIINEKKNEALKNGDIPLYESLIKEYCNLSDSLKIRLDK